MPSPNPRSLEMVDSTPFLRESMKPGYDEGLRLVSGVQMEPANKLRGQDEPSERSASSDRASSSGSMSMLTISMLRSIID